MKKILMGLILASSLSAMAEWEVFAGGHDSQVTSSTVGTGFSSTAQVGAEAGVNYVHKFNPYFGFRLGVGYTQTGLEIQNTSGSFNLTITEGLFVVPLKLDLYLAPHFYLFGGGNYWTLSGITVSGNTGNTATTIYNTEALLGSGFTPSAGFGFLIGHFLVEARDDIAYAFQTLPTGQTTAGQVQSYALDIGFVF